jgi:hypothetical protein
VPLGVDPWIGHDEIGCWMSMVGFETTGVARKDGRRPLTLLIVMVVVLGVPLSYFSGTKDGHHWPCGRTEGGGVCLGVEDGWTPQDRSDHKVNQTLAYSNVILK